MGFLTLLRAGAGGNVGGATTAADPQLQFFENFPGHYGQLFVAHSQNTLSVHAVNIPLSQSFKTPVVLMSLAGPVGDRDVEIQFGLYSMNAGTLSLANSAEKDFTFTEDGVSWISLVTSAAQNITPGPWYFALNMSTNGAAGGGQSLYANSSLAPGNAIPGGFLMGRMTVSTNAMPTAIVTTELDITGADATRQPYIIITA